MATTAPVNGHAFARPPRTVVDDENRALSLAVTTDAHEGLLAMYEDFDDGDRSQGIPPRTTDGTRTWVTDLLADGYNVVARHDGGIVGHAALVPTADRAELAIFVHPAYRNAGVGTAVISALLGGGHERGIERVWLCVERSNIPAIALYDSVGFETVNDGLEKEMELVLTGDGVS
jgi:ribosomal protein S18 acetylase RimI-like enzyme